MFKLVFHAALVLSALGFRAQAQFGSGPDVTDSPWNIQIQVTGGSVVPPGLTLPATLAEFLGLSGGQIVTEHALSRDIVLSGVNSSPGYGNWTYLYNAAGEVGVKFATVLWNQSGPVALRTEVLRLKPIAQNSSDLPGSSGEGLTGTYTATLQDFSGNIIYQVTGTLTATALPRININDNLVCSNNGTCTMNQ